MAVFDSHKLHMLDISKRPLSRFDPVLPSLLCSRLQKSINVHFGSAHSDIPPPRMQRQKPRLMFNAFRSKVGIYFSAQETRGEKKLRSYGDRLGGRKTCWNKLEFSTLYSAFQKKKQYNLHYY
ncbi:hypothetical protein CDAR_319691 [Caerostris darwini]|uniref:Uncharacterized protein n=1 Tax=Caerostris darwini TaxID=1538125 RepID=A0AAV4M969_9ARAC|nr:hypothetical protein CDAR_319691 [Caerostris darwini]